MTPRDTEMEHRIWEAEGEREFPERLGVREEERLDNWYENAMWGDL